MKKNCTEEDKNQKRSNKIQKKGEEEKKKNNKVRQKKRSVSKGSDENLHSHRKVQKERMKTDFFAKRGNPFFPTKIEPNGNTENNISSEILREKRKLKCFFLFSNFFDEKDGTRNKKNMCSEMQSKRKKEISKRTKVKKGKEKRRRKNEDFSKTERKTRAAERSKNMKTEKEEKR